MRPKSTGVVYFILCPSQGLIKIGLTKGDPLKRFRVIRTMNAAPVEPLALMPGNRADEMALHDRFREDWSHGEWFRASAPLLAYIEAVGRPWTVPKPKVAPPFPLNPRPIPTAEWEKTVYIRLRGEWRTLDECLKIAKRRLSKPVIRAMLHNGIDAEDIFFARVF